MTAFSFYATKNITSGEGGALTTNNAEWAERVQIMALHGISRDAWKRYGTSGYAHWDILAPGYKYNMFDLQGALALSQLGKIDRFYARRVAVKARLDAGLRGLPGLSLPVERPDCIETTALGAAGLAGIAAGLWPNAEAFIARREFKVFTPKMSAGEATKLRAGWDRAAVPEYAG